MPPLYDTIGLNYARLRQPDPRIAQRIDTALGDARTVINVGAGAGSYEPPGRDITAVEPSSEMIAQRPDTGAAVVQAFAENLPFADAYFDAAMAVLTLHHWSDKARGVAEMRRVARGPLVFLAFDAAFRGFWLTNYFPDLITLDEERMPAFNDFSDWLGPVTVTEVPIPHDCTDGFLAAYWRRPAAYLDERVRAAMSSFWALGDVSDGVARLRNDLESGEWEARYGDLLQRDALDCGYRLVVAK